jgi:hypothetical protein
MLANLSEARLTQAFALQSQTSSVSMSKRYIQPAEPVYVHLQPMCLGAA